MPVRSRGRFLAGITALMGLCCAGTGCHTNPLWSQVADSRTTVARAWQPSLRYEDNIPSPSSSSAVSILQPVPWNPDVKSSNLSSEAVQQVRAIQLDGAPELVGHPPIPPVQPYSDVAPPEARPPVWPGESAVTQAKKSSASQDSKVNPVIHMGKPHAIPLVPDAPREFEKQSLPLYMIEPPDVLLINVSQSITKPRPTVAGQHLVRPDGYVTLGVYGDVYVAGLTLDGVREAVAQRLKERVGGDLTIDGIKKELQVDVLSYNSKVYYIIFDGAGNGQQMIRQPITGNETVLDAIALVGGLTQVASTKQIWIARATPGDMHHPTILPVDWHAVTQKGDSKTNYQVFPGDRIFVHSQKLIRADTFLAKVFSPIERILGITLLGSTTVNSIRTNPNAFGNGNNFPR